MPCSWKCTRSRRAPRATPPTRCGSICLEPLLRRARSRLIDRIVEREWPDLVASRARSSRPKRRPSWRSSIALDERFAHAVQLVRDCRGRVIVTGMGKSGIICRKIAATLSSTGTPAFFLHPAEAVHGDLGVIQADDVVIALSYSGETEELTAGARDDQAARRAADRDHRRCRLDAGAGRRRRARLPASPKKPAR